MKTCIWCLKNENEVPFEKDSHILPQKLGSIILCEDVCDPCNEFFGQKKGRFKPAIDIALKEMFIISKYKKQGSLVSFQNKMGKKNTKDILGKYIDQNMIRTLNRDTEFFRFSEKNGKIGFKRTELIKYHFRSPNELTNKLKRGLFKIAFETIHIEKHLKEGISDFYNSHYDYIREFVRWNKGNLRIFYIKREIGIELETIDSSTHPEVLLHETQNNYIRFDVLGHIFAISLGKSNLTEHLLIKEFSNDSLFSLIEVKNFYDIDIFQLVFNEKYS